MSKLRYGWWSYVKDMIRRYPELREEYLDLHKTSMTASYSEMPKGRYDRALESAVIRELPSTKQREYEAVRCAIEMTERYQNAHSILYMIKLVYWDKRYTLEGAALMIPCSIATAKRYHGEFIRLVASYYGLLD